MSGAPRALVLAAGLGTRLRPITIHTPKCLVAVAGRCLLDRWHEKLVACGVRDAVINAHAHADQVIRHVSGLNALGTLRWRVARESTLLGSAGALRQNLSLLRLANEILIVYSDNVTTVDLGELLAAHRCSRHAFTMALFHTPHPEACGIAETDADGTVIGFAEKPARPRSSLANAGLYVASPETLTEELLRDARDIASDVLPRLIGRMGSWMIRGYHRDVRDLEALRAIERDVARGALCGNRRA